eukprot:3940621-Rhodomonas_salina.2
MSAGLCALSRLRTSVRSGGSLASAVVPLVLAGGSLWSVMVRPSEERSARSEEGSKHASEAGRMMPGASSGASPRRLFPS